MTFDAFTQINRIPGKSLDNKHKDWIEITYIQQRHLDDNISDWDRIRNKVHG